MASDFGTETDDGSLLLSKKRADFEKAWDRVQEAKEEQRTITAMVTDRVKGGLVVDLGIRGFVPASHVGNGSLKTNLERYVGQSIPLKVIEVDKERRKVVLSNKLAQEEERQSKKAETIASLQPGKICKGIVRRLTNYGAFVDLGGIDGLLHITDLAWRRVRHPSEVLTVGDEVTAKVLKFDQEKNRVSLGLKQLGEDPWVGISRRYPSGTRLFGKVTNITDYGAFVEIESGIEGLVHVSEMDWTNKNIHPTKVVQLGDEVEVMILEIDEDRRRISLGMKQCMANPWDDFAINFKKGDKVKGAIKSITDFGVFIGLPGGIDGLVHLSDLSWTTTGEDAIRSFKKGDEVEAMVLAIDVEKERISLGVKQLEGDPFTSFIATHEKNSVVKGAVKSVDAKGAVVSLSEEVEGYLRASEFSRDRIEDLSSVLKVGDEVDAMIVNVDRKSRQINLSIKAKDSAEQHEALQKIASEGVGAAGTTNLGALLKAKLNQNQQG